MNSNKHLKVESTSILVRKLKQIPNKSWRPCYANIKSGILDPTVILAVRVEMRETTPPRAFWGFNIFPARPFPIGSFSLDSTSLSGSVLLNPSPLFINQGTLKGDRTVCDLGMLWPRVCRERASG